MKDWSFDNNWTDELETDIEQDSNLEDLRDKQYRSYYNKTYQVIKEVNQIGMPVKGEQLRLVTFRPFNSAVFLAYICEHEIIEELYIAVFSFNYEACQLLVQKINEGKIKKVIILMSNYRNAAYRLKEQLTNEILKDHKNVELFFCHSHAKIISMKTSEGNYYHIEGSGNMTFSARVEQYIIDNDKGLFDFTKGWFTEIKVFLKGKKELVLTN